MTYQVSNILKSLLVLTLFNLVLATQSPVYALDCISGAEFENPELTHILCPIARAFNVLVLSAGAVLIIIIMFGAYKFATSMGDPKGIQGAYMTFLYAIVGFAIVIGVYTILMIVFSWFGADTSIILNPFDTVQQGICNFVNNISKDGIPLVEIDGC